MKWPYIQYIKNGETVTIKMPDDLDVWEFLEWMDREFMGLTAEKLAELRAADMLNVKHRAKARK